jgi:hypothetical protein
MKFTGFPNSIVIPVVSIALGAAAAVAVVGSSSDEQKRLKSHLAVYRGLQEDQQKMVNASFAEFSLQSDARKQEIRSLHEAVQHDVELKEGLERYSVWWSSLSQAEWDSFPKMTRDQQIGFARARINKPAEAERTVVVDFADWGRTSLQPLHLTIEECGKIITDSLKDIRIPPEITDELQQLESPEHRSLALSLWMFGQLRIDSDREARAFQREKILHAVLANVSDVSWKAQFEQIVADNTEKPYFRFWMLRNLLVIFDQSTMALGNRLTKQFPVSEDEIVTAFVNMEDKVRQHSLMVMPPDEANKELEFLARSSRAQTPEQKLLVKFIEFTRDHQRIIGDIIFGLGNRPPQIGNDGPAPRARDGK